MRELRHITKKRIKKKSLNKGAIVAVLLIFILILAGAYSFMTKEGRRVSPDLTPGNIYTDSRGQNEGRDTGKDVNTGEGSQGDEGVEKKSEDFTFYKVLNSKEGEVAPLNVEPSRSELDKEEYKVPGNDKKTDYIDTEIVKKIESRDKDEIVYTVQIGALRQERAANELAAQIRSRGYAPYITRYNSPGSPPVYKVRIGRFLSMVDAQEVAAVLKREGFGTYVIKTSVRE